MSEWSNGYTTDIGYTYGYYGELNPISLKIPFLMAGLAAPKVVNACELGFGQGISINSHAAATDTKWFGTDFNPSQTSFAQETANVSGAKVALFDQGFNEFCTRDDLPEFDFIGLHGIWSWISNENHGILTDFLRRKLKVGGVLYISYNTLPGWAVGAPVRHMLTQHASVMGTTGDGSIARVQKSMDFTKKLFSLCDIYQKKIPSISAIIKEISEKPPQYLAHEYFNRDWKPMYFSEMAECLSESKVDYACSTSFLHDFESLNFTTEQSSFLNEISDEKFKQSAKDFMLNTQFRKDYWVKGARKISKLKHEEIWFNLRFLMTSNKESVDLKILHITGTTELLPTIFQPIIDALSDNNIHTVKSIQQAIIDKEINNKQLFEALAILYSKKDIYLVQDDEEINSAKEKCHRLNTVFLKNSLESDEVKSLVSPVTGGAILVNRIEQLFLYNYSQGIKDQKNYVENVWRALDSVGHRLVKDGETLQTESENLKEINELAEKFESNGLLVAKKLQLIAF